MICTQIARILLFFSISSLYHNVIFASLLEGTLVATTHGLVPIQALKVGDKVLGYDLEEPNHEKATREVAVTKIEKHLTDSLFTMCTETGWVEASPHQLIFTLLPETAENKVRVMDFVEAQNITEEYQLIDTQMRCLPIFETNRMSLSCTCPQQYAEKKKHGKHKKVKEISRCKVSVNMYALEVEAPHVFLIGENPYVKDITKTRLLLTHNGIPALLPLTYQVASSSALSFPSILGGISVVGGPVVLALGITGLGYLGYQLFKSHDNSKQPSFYIERASSSSPGGMDPKEPRDKKDKEDASENDPSIKSLIKDKQLPTQGKIRYVPPKDLKVTEGLPCEKIGNDKAFIDRFGNKWIKGPSRTPGEPFEWDVQLSNKGKEQLGWASKSGKHINVSLKGHITH